MTDRSIRVVLVELNDVVRAQVLGGRVDAQGFPDDADQLTASKIGGWQSQSPSQLSAAARLALRKPSRGRFYANFDLLRDRHRLTNRQDRDEAFALLWVIRVRTWVAERPMRMFRSRWRSDPRRYFGGEKEATWTLRS